jgi:hypothetical protein
MIIKMGYFFLLNSGIAVISFWNTKSKSIICADCCYLCLTDCYQLYGYNLSLMSGSIIAIRPA